MQSVILLDDIWCYLFRMVVVFLGRLAQFALSLLLTRLATSFLSPAEFGRLAILNSLIFFFSLLLVNPIGMYLNRQLHQWEKDKTLKLNLDSFVSYLLLASLTTGLSLYIFHFFFSVGMEISPFWLVLIVAGSIITLTANQTFTNSINMLNKRDWFIALTLLTLIFSGLFGYFLIIQWQETAESWILGFMLSQAILAVASYLFLKKKFFTKSTKSVSADLAWGRFFIVFGFSWPVAIAVSLNWIQYQSYRFFVTTSVGLEKLGLFVAGYSVAAGVFAGLESVLSTYFLPNFYRKISSEGVTGQADAWNTYFSIVKSSLLLTSIFMVFCAQDLCKILLGSHFQSANQYVLWGIIAESARVLFNVYSLVSHVKMATRTLIFPSVLGSTTALAALWILPKNFGLAGAGAALSLAGIVGLIAIHFSTKKVFPIQLVYSSHLKSISIATALALIIPAINYLLPYFSGRSLVFLFLTGCGLLGALYLALREHIRNSEIDNSRSQL